MEQCNWKSANVTELFIESVKRSMADLTLWSSKEFGGREKKMKKLIKELQNTKQSFEHYEKWGKT